MRVYYVESALSEGELAEVVELMHQRVEQIRIPYVLPVVDRTERRMMSWY